MKVLVTGADGFLGNNIIRELLDRGLEVRAFLQEGRTVQTLDKLSIEKYYGDLLNAGEVEKAAEGGSSVFLNLIVSVIAIHTAHEFTHIQRPQCFKFDRAANTAFDVNGARGHDHRHLVDHVW